MLRLGLSRLKKGGLSHGIDPVNNSGYFASGGVSEVAAQQKLGVWTKRWNWTDSGYRFGTGTAESVLD